MDRGHSSPVLLQHSSPPHTLSPQLQTLPPPTIDQPEPSFSATPPPHEQPPSVEAAMSEPAERPAITSESQPQPAPQIEEPHSASAVGDRPSDGVADGGTGVTASTEAPPSEALPGDATVQPAQNPIQVTSSAEAQAVEQTEVTETAIETTPAPAAPEAQPVTTTPEAPNPAEESEFTPPPPPPPVEVPKPEIPEWLMYEEDMSVPDDVELKEIETGNEDVSALDFKHHEKYFFHQVDDPEQRPIKRFRLHWTIKGVRGTKDNPNYARVLNSPPAYIHGLYWHVKFFPRGNNSSALSAYIKCSRNPPDLDPEVPEGTFAVFQGTVDTDLCEVKPDVEVKFPARLPRPREDGKSSSSSDMAPADHKINQPEIAERVSRDEIHLLLLPKKPRSPVKEDEDDWRVSAQLGLIVYNPEEPRTGHWSTSEHQFNKHNDDWGWTNFSGPWKDIHRRKRGQRAPLLRNDIIAMDAYIQIFDDPTQALWWHSSPDTESQWDSKSLAGYFPTGTPPLYHSPGVAGLTALLLLAPFRKLIQNIDTSLWRRDSRVKPQPLLCQLQHVLFLMRSMRKDETYVNVNHVLETLDTFGETYWEVKAFWEALRRSIELEVEGNNEAHMQLARIFDGNGKDAVSLTPSGYVKIPVSGVGSVQGGLDAILGPERRKLSFPDFLPILLDRQKFDESSREWKVLYDRVRMSEEINLSAYSNNEDPAEYTLYGFIAHVGERASGKFYSVLRPNGPGTKWLAFEDGDGNKVFSYTKRRIEKYEGFEGEDLKTFKGTSQTAYLVMYIRTSRLKEYLPGSLEPYDMADWLKPYLKSRWHGEEKEIAPTDAGTETQIEIYFGSSVRARHGLLDMFNLKEVDKENYCALTVPSESTFAEVRQQLATMLKIERVEKIRLWIMQYSPLGEYMTASMDRVPLADPVGPEAKEVRPLSLWLQIIDNEADVKLFGFSDPTPEEIQARKKELEEDALMDDDEPQLFMATTSGERDGFGDSLQANIMDDNLAATVGTPVTLAAILTTTAETLAPAEVESSNHEINTTLPTPAGTAVPVEAHVTAVGPLMSGAQTEPAEVQQHDTSAGPDALQASVEEAVRHDVEASAIATNEFPVPALTLQTDSAQPDSTRTPSADHTDIPVEELGQPSEAALGLNAESSGTPVEHGHLVDAVNVPGLQEGESALTGTSVEATPPPVASAGSGSQAENEALIAYIIAAEVAAAEAARSEDGSGIDVNAPVTDGAVRSLEAEAADGSVVPTAQTGDTPHTVSTPPSEPVREERPPRPVRHIYGFIQIFDADQQDFFVRDSFFAEWTADVKATVRTHLGFAAEKEFLVWQRIKAYNTSPISSSTAFSDIDFRDGVDLIVGNVLSDEKKDELLAEGKFVTPSSLSLVLLMTARKHPVEGFTGTITLQDFGRGFYQGPMLNGRYHGDHATWIMANGHQYKGSFLSDEKSGAGTMIYQNGDTYEGTWLKDEKHGRGTSIEKRTGNKYVGGYEHGKRWGEGVTYWKVADEQSDMCQICYCEEVDALFYDCGHVCACVECAKQCESCPICRKPVAKVVKMYKA